MAEAKTLKASPEPLQIKGLWMDYGIIGNCVTCALVRKDAAIEWMCYPTFSSPSVFAKLLDEEKGGSFEILPKGKHSVQQQYLPNTAILETVFSSKKKSDVFVVYDFFPRYKKLVAKNRTQLIKQNGLMRIVKPLVGTPAVRFGYNPGPGYAEKEPEFSEQDAKLKCVSNGSSITLSSNVKYSDIREMRDVQLDSEKYFVIAGEQYHKKSFSLKECENAMRATRKYWQEWCNTLVTPRLNREMIVRSAITLKLLTYSPTGAIMAAATTSLPETIGGQRNWDYRFCWVRDASFCVDALKKIGRNDEPKELMQFFMNKALSEKKLQIMYGINGETRLEERELNHLGGYKGSKPVRIGNAAYNQTQHDMYGEIIDIMYLYFAYYEYEKRMSAEQWRFLEYLVQQIRQNWKKPDNGIWEFRGQMQHFTFSKFMCFVGVDRAVKLAQYFSRSSLVRGWIGLRDEIKEDILKNGFSHELGAFTMHFGSKSLDASLLQMCYYEFLSSTDPRIVSTVKRIYKKLRKGKDLVKRYDTEDDFGHSNTAFTICSFWLIDALHHIGEIDKAKRLYSELIRRCNHLGLFSEGVDVRTKQQRGNFPQAYTHIAVINSSILLSEWFAKRRKIDWSTLPKRKKWF